MNLINQAKSLHELKSIYHSLAKRYHPDCGGSNHTMLMINNAYQMRKKILENSERKFHDLKISETIYINGTEALVILITKSKFVARAKGRSKQAWFDLKTGIGIDFPHYQASFNPIYISSKS